MIGSDRLPSEEGGNTGEPVATADDVSSKICGAKGHDDVHCVECCSAAWEQDRSDVIARVRAETIEECASVAENYRQLSARRAGSARAVGIDDMTHVEHGLAAMYIAGKIRALGVRR
jgi:hypothetical protein